MPEILLALVGGFLVVLTYLDVFATTLGVGAGPRPLSRPLANLLRRVLRLAPSTRPVGGPLILLSAVGLWIGLLWTGYSLVFLGDGGAVTSATTGEQATTTSRIYYAGYTLFTLGNGGYAPSPGMWQIVTALAALNGLFTVTLSITYLLPVVERRRFAAMVSSLGGTAEEAVTLGWNGRDFSMLESQLSTLAQHIQLNAQRQLAYPVLNDFQSSDPSTASARSLALLDDVVTILEHGVAAGVGGAPPGGSYDSNRHRREPPPRPDRRRPSGTAPAPRPRDSG